MNIQKHIRKVLMEENSDKMIKLVGQYLNVMHPRFNEKDVGVYEYEDSRGFPVVVFTDIENGIYFIRILDGLQSFTFKILKN